MDDFGTGYSSMAYLRQFPLHALKIDRSFLDGLGTSKEDMAIVESVIQLGVRPEVVTALPDAEFGFDTADRHDLATR